MKLRYRPGKDNIRADALSRRDQDMLKDEGDEHASSREFTMLVPAYTPDYVLALPVRTQETSLVSETLPQPPDLLALVREHWVQAAQDDTIYQEVLAAVREGRRSLSSTRKIAISLSDCTIDQEERLQWRGRVWVPDFEPLRTGVI